MGKNDEKNNSDGNNSDYQENDDLKRNLDPQDKFSASYVTPPEDNENFDFLLGNVSQKIRLKTTTGAFLSDQNFNIKSRKLAVKNNTGENDILAQIEKEEEEAQKLNGENDDDAAINIDELMNQAEYIQEERLKDISLSKIPRSNNSRHGRPSMEEEPSNVNDPSGNSWKMNPAKRQQIRFSTSFDDQEMKNNLVQSHSQFRKRINTTVNQDIKLTNSQSEENQEEEEKSGDNSLATEEDLENYLEKLELEVKNKSSSEIQNEKSQDNPNENEDEKRQKSISNISKSSLQKNLIDVIEEVEGEDDENFLNSDESFTKEFYQTMHQDVLMRSMKPNDQRRSAKILELTKDDWDYKDMIKMIDWNERRYQEIAKKKLKENSELSLKNIDTKDVKIKTFTNFQDLKSITAKMVKEKSFSQARATCVGLSDDLLLIGNSDGEVWMFDRESEEDYNNFSEKNKEFIGNAVTAMDVHPNRTEYIVLGYERGQMVLFDATDPKKSIKVIKDHHKNSTIINIKFVDWIGKTPNKYIDQVTTEQTKQQIFQEEDKQAWMFISIDQFGKVIINSIQKILFGLKASKHIIVDPTKLQTTEPLFTAISCRFQSKFHGIGQYDDIPMISLGNANEVRIMEARPNYHTDFLTIARPNMIYNKSTNDYEMFYPVSPCLSWGFGHSPVLKERPHSMLAISWGPLIQLVVLIDHEETDNPFIEDGYYILKNFNRASLKIIKQPKIRKSVRFSSIKKENNNDRSTSSISQQNSKNNQSQEERKKSFLIDESKTFSEDKEIVYEDLYDDSQAFNIQGLAIEWMQFVADSILMVVTASQEIRLLYTQQFNPDVYNPQKIKLENNQSLKVQFRNQQKNQPELEQGLWLPNVLRSEFGMGSYHQTMKFFQTKLIVLSAKNIQTCNHLSWQQSIYEFKKQVHDDLIKVFSRALDIFKGKVKGFAGIPDNNTIREITLKADLKLIIREIICQVIEQTQQTTNRLTITQFSDDKPSLDGQGDKTKEDRRKTNSKKEFEEERKKKYQTLIRIAIEFCVELKDCDFLFYDLFLLFQEEKLDDEFIKELEPFILAGKFQEWELPNDVIQNHVIKYYKNDPSKADVLEKIIINLNFNQCPKTIVLEFIHFSEQNFLSTAILFLLTQVFEKKDNTSCVQVLCSLFDLYKKSSKKSQVSKIDLQMLRELEYDSADKKEIEKSSLYLGYKILWVIRLFIDGKKFPQGNIREKKWRSYIHDVIQFLSTQEYLQVLLEIDAEALFQVISILFYPSRPFELVQMGREEMGFNNLKSSSHNDFLRDLNSYCLHEKTPDQVKNQYLFFVANVVAKSGIQGIHRLYYFNITKELMSKHRRYVDFNKQLHEMSSKKRKRIIDKLNQSSDQQNIKEQQKDELKYLQKTENDFINLLKLSEPLENNQISDNQVKVYLLEKKEEYIKCLQMLLTDYRVNEVWTAELQAEKVIKWIKEKLALLEERSQKSIVDKNIFEQFKREVTQNIKKIVVMNAKEAIKLIEEKFGANHKEMIDLLSRDPIEQMLYLETLLEEQDQTIQETIKNYGLMSTNPIEAKRYIEFMKLHLKLCCQHNQQKVLGIVEKMVKNTYYPIQDCLQICQEHDQIEAAFLLNKKLGKYYDSVTQGITIIQNKVDLTKLKIELYFAKKRNISIEFPITHDQMNECALFDSVFKKIMKICKKNSKEVEHDKEELVWFIVVDSLQELKNNEIVAYKKFCKEFFQKRINLFLEALVRVIPFQNFLNHILSLQSEVQFKEYKDIILKLFHNNHSESIVLQNANNAIYKVNTELFSQFSQQTRKGILFRQRYCPICRKYMDSFLYDENDESTQDEYNNISDEDEEDEIYEPYFYDSSKEPIKIFACKHTFHIRCIKKHYKSKIDEVEELFMRKVEKLRCPICNLKNYEIDNENQKNNQNKKVGGGSSSRLKQEDKNFGSGKSGTESVESGRSNRSEDPFERKLQKKYMRMTMKSQSLINKQMMKINNRMNFFEGQIENQGLSIKDFKRV